MAERERESDSKGVVNTGDALVVQESIAHSRMQNTYYSFYYRLNFFTFCYNWSCIVAHYYLLYSLHQRILFDQTV